MKDAISAHKVFGSAFTKKLCRRVAQISLMLDGKFKLQERFLEVSWHCVAKEPNFSSLTVFAFLSISGYILSKLTLGFIDRYDFLKVPTPVFLKK